MLEFLEDSGAFFFRTDDSGDLVYLSQAFAALEGKDASHYFGQSLLAIFKGNEDEAASALARLRQGRNQVKLVSNIRTTHASGPEKLHFTLRPCLNNQGEWIGVEGIAIPFEHPDSGKKQKNLENRLEEAEKIKDRFLSNISHEIRTPLNGIMGMVQLLQKTNLDFDQKEFLNIISKSGENLLQTLNQLIDLSVDLGGKLKIQEDEIDVGKLFSFMSSLYAEQAMLKEIDLDFQVKGTIPLLKSDEFRIQQILKQLISNAISFTTKGVIQVTARLESGVGSPLLVLEVSDSGTGIEIGQQPAIESILRKDGSAENSFTTARGGLGLLTVRMISEALLAEPGFVSAPGKGSTFWIKIPVGTLIPDKKPGLEMPEDSNSIIRKMSPRILLTDDNAVNLRVASEILSRAGCRVVLATNGKEALEKASKEFFHLIFMDIQMPVMDGLEASLKIQNLQLENPPAIVAMTAYVMNEDKRRFLEAGMDDFIPKPISGDQLLARVRHWTEKSLLKNPLSETLYQQQEDGDAQLKKIFDFEVLRNLKKHLGEEMLLASIEEFALELRQMLDGIGRALEIRDIEELGRYFHTLKGNAGTFGLDKLTDFARDLESKVKNKDFAAVLSGMGRLEESCNEFLNTYTLLYTNYEWKN